MMRRVIPLLLLALVMCQCGQNNQPKENNGSAKTVREQYPEKFTDAYVTERVTFLVDNIIQGAMEKDPSLKLYLTERYGDLLTEALALPYEFITETAAAWVNIGLMESLSCDQDVTEVNFVDDQNAYVMFAGCYGELRMDLSFVGDDWVVDDIQGTSQAYLAELIQSEREWFKSFVIDYEDEIEELVEDGSFTEEEATEAVMEFKEEIEEYFAKYPEE